MSSRLVSRTDIDALVTVAMQWTDSGHVTGMPEPARTVLSVTPEDASAVGRVLWQANVDSFYFGGPPEACDPEVRAEAQEQLEANGGTGFVADYRFEPLPGVASPAAAAHVAGYYAYQTEGDAWDPSYPSARNGDPRPPFAAYFVTAVRWYALALRGALPLDRVPEPSSPELTDAEDRLTGDRPDLPWGLDESNRDAFARSV